MKITEHLDLIEKLVLDRATPAEIRGQIQIIRDQLQAYEKEAALHTERKTKIEQLEAANLELKAEKARRESDDAKGFSGFQH